MYQRRQLVTASCFIDASLERAGGNPYCSAVIQYQECYLFSFFQKMGQGIPFEGQKSIFGNGKSIVVEDVVCGDAAAAFRKFCQFVLYIISDGTMTAEAFTPFLKEICWEDNLPALHCECPWIRMLCSRHKLCLDVLACGYLCTGIFIMKEIGGPAVPALVKL